jgi:hypothetical protein
LIEVKHASENIAEKVACVVQEFGLLDKIFFVTLDNASFNAKAMEPAPDPLDPNKVKYNLMHQRCACHIINLIVKSGLKRFKPSAINFLNSSN